MIFSSITYLYDYLPCVLVLYYLAPSRWKYNIVWKNSILLLASLFFYAWGEPRYLIFMILSVLQGYAAGLLIEKYRGSRRAKITLTASAVFSLGLLGYCKYADFFISGVNAMTGLSIPLLKLALPIGISFYTFQILSYVVDVYRGTVRTQRSLLKLALYVVMFPQLIAGPIVRYAEIEDALTERTHTVEKAALGVRRFTIGMAKKVMIANALGELVRIFRASGEKSVVFFWIYAVAYSLQIYFDFSGYSDMAIGLGHLFGFDFPENFRYPYISRSITEFWRRWHMTLGGWFRDYVYIPLGGNRVSKGRWMLNLLIVWMLTGLWHGAAMNFVVWGLFFGLFLMVEKLWLLKHLEKHRILGHLYVLLLVIISFVIFGASDMREAAADLTAMFGGAAFPAVTAESLYYLKSYGILLLLALVGATPFAPAAVAAVRKRPVGEKLVNLLEPLFLLALLAVATAGLVNGSFNPFLYFRF